MVAVFIACVLLQLGLIVSAVIAVLVSFCVSYLFLAKLRREAADSLERRFSGKGKTSPAGSGGKDSAAEDAIVDSNPQIGVDVDRPPRRYGEDG